VPDIRPDNPAFFDNRYTAGYRIGNPAKLTRYLSVELKIRPDIRYPACTGYPAGYQVSGFWIDRMSGRPNIRQNQYPVHPYKKHRAVDL
jgi:hypothetical protein